MTGATLDFILLAVPVFSFGYPFVMSWYWMAGGIIFGMIRERGLPPLDQPPELGSWPPISLLVPCYNESNNAEETLGAALACDYPDFEVIAINDGSRDNTGAVLDAIAAREPRLRVVHLVKNQGKATALTAGALLARHEILVCIDGDALVDPYCLRWIARTFERQYIGAITGNPRIRNRTTILGQLQVGEFSSIVGLIKRAESVYGRLFTISGVMCAFRKRALADAGWWSSRTITEDVDVTWRIQLAGWRVTYEPNAVCWILMPETLSGLWRQRLRWATGGSQMMIDFFVPMITGRRPTLLPIYFNYLVSVLWAYCVLFGLALGVIEMFDFIVIPKIHGLQLVPEWWGIILATTYLIQGTLSQVLERRYEPRVLRSLFWSIWYPMAFWLISAVTAAVGMPLAFLQRRKATWTSPDRGLR